MNKFLDEQKVKMHIETAKSIKKSKKIFSDVVDKHGNQYVNLVQEGGGVLGIALVGFTFIIETAGLRFWRLAGTSAGAINAMLLAAIGEKHESKSETILSELDAMKFSDFADGHNFVKRVLRYPGFFKKITTLLLGFLMLILLGLILTAIHFNQTFAFFILCLIVIFVLVCFNIAWLWNRFRYRKWGLCRGNVFHKWMNDILKKNGVHTFTDLKKKAYLNADHLSYPKVSGSIPSSDLTLIACDITNGIKVQFPEDMQLYGLSDGINPADFVRASMSIPVFFETFSIKNEACRSEMVQDKWKEIGFKDVYQEESFFVDGGVVSNFPINIFHSPGIKTPRMPVIGLILDEGTEPKEDIFKSIVSYIYKIFNTIRYHSDKDFLRKNNFYKNYCVRNINVAGFNWLNFEMDDKEKIALFLSGVEAGIDHLNTFDWEKYKTEREKI